MVKFLLIVIVVLIVVALFKSKLHIKWGTFFKKGFKKLDDLFGVVCYCAKQRKTEKHMKLYVFVKNNKPKMKI